MTATCLQLGYRGKRDYWRTFMDFGPYSPARLNTKEPNPGRKEDEHLSCPSTGNREAERENSIWHGHPSTMQLWWARRPRAACRAADAYTVTVTKNEILTSLNRPEAFILTIVLMGENGPEAPFYVTHSFIHEPDFATVSVNFKLEELLACSHLD